MNDETTARTGAAGVVSDDFDTRSWAGIALKDCDLVMKGGITSGVVYPGAIFALGKHHRFRSIGGASAGAIAAAMAAAAEYRRQKYESADGFREIGELGKELGETMSSLFQPVAPMRRLFDLLMRWVSSKSTSAPLKATWALLASYPGFAFIGVVPAALAVLATLGAGDLLTERFGQICGPIAFWGLMGLSLLVGVMTTILALAAAIGHDVFVELPRNRFGICPGIKQGSDARTPAGLTDWICDGIDRIARGRKVEKSDPPLTIGDLKSVGIELAAMTTDLSSHRPYQLPLHTKIHFFDEDEFRQLLPGRVVDHLVARSQTKVTTNGENGIPKVLLQLPVGDDFPVCLVARMSLSFPLLIQAMPLYRCDYSLREAHPEEKDTAGDRAQGGGEEIETTFIRRCLFSDGGISSNFPIHFFDGILPTRPTFGITLADFEANRHGTNRLRLPTKRRQAGAIPVKEITSIPGFAMAIVDTAKDWHDTLQSLLPGYAERIVEIRLDPEDEGGLNLDMTDKTIGKLVAMGTEAGRMFGEGTFDMAEHCNRRALTVLPQLGAVAGQVAAAFDPKPNTWRVDYDKTISQGGRYYSGLPDAFRTDTLLAIAKGLEAMDGAHGAQLKANNLPVVDARIRLVADADRVPRG